MSKPAAIHREDLKPCAACGKGVLHGGGPVTYRVTFEQHLVNPGAVSRAHGLETYFGGGVRGATLAHVMGTGEPLFHPVSQVSALFCSDCFMSPDNWLGYACEQASEQAAKVESEA